MNTTVDNPTRISTPFALIFAGQYLGRTANIRHLLNNTMAKASWKKLILININIKAGSNKRSIR
jgi:hypothetical protein